MFLCLHCRFLLFLSLQFSSISCSFITVVIRFLSKRYALSLPSSPPDFLDLAFHSYQLDYIMNFDFKF